MPSAGYAYSDPNDNSRLTSMTYPNGRVLDYGYNDNALDNAIGRLDYLADAGGALAGHLADYTYLGLDTPVSEAYGNSVTENIMLTDFGQTAEINYVNTTTSSSTDDFQYGYERSGNVLYKNNLLSPSNSELYHANSTTSGDDNTAYDPLNRLVAFARSALSASGNNGSSLDTVATASATQNWSLSAVGDQAAVTTNGTTTSNTTNSQNELTANGSASLTYDANGNTTTDENGHTLVYDAWNRLVSVSGSTTVLANYSYDGTGRRITETEGGTTTDLYYSNQWQVLEERQGGTVADQYVWGPFYVNQLVLRDSEPSSIGELGTAGSGLGLRLYVQQDADWNVVSLTDVNGNVLQRFEYSSYGVVMVLNADWSSGTAVFGSTDAYGWIYGFQGGRYDPATGLYHFGGGGGNAGRDEDPATGVWQEQDPAGYVDGVSFYQFERSEVPATVDASGRQTSFVLLPVIDSTVLAEAWLIDGGGRTCWFGPKITAYIGKNIELTPIFSLARQAYLRNPVDGTITIKGPAFQTDNRGGAGPVPANAGIFDEYFGVLGDHIGVGPYSATCTYSGFCTMDHKEWVHISFTADLPVSKSVNWGGWKAFWATGITRPYTILGLVHVTRSENWCLAPQPPH